VLWYSFGRYNSSSGTIDGVPAGQTSWGTPTAASVFQDIRSDNWNGSNPPTFGVPSSYGTTGYYIQRTTGNVFFNNGIFRGDVNTNGDAKFTGDNPTTIPVTVAGTTYNVDYSVSALAATNSPGQARIGQFGYASSSSSGINAGVVGIADTLSRSYGVVGQSSGSGGAGGFFSNSSSAGIGLVATNTGGGTALFVDGPMTITNSTRVTNLNADFARTLIGTTSNQLRFVSGTSTGSSIATFSGAAKPGGMSTNVWMTIQIDSTTLYIPVWS
jgi:hypothetical protein